jgi:hypothetical protein
MTICVGTSPRSVERRFMPGTSRGNPIIGLVQDSNSAATPRPAMPFVGSTLALQHELPIQEAIRRHLR